MAAENIPQVIPTAGAAPPSPYCIFCLKGCVSECKPLHQTRNKKGSRNNSKYVTIERFLGLDELNSRSTFGFQFCPDCSLLLDQFAEQYEALRRLELELEWKIGKIKRIMECASRVPSRIALLKEYHEYHHHHSSSTTATGSEEELMKGSSEQVEEWRRKFIRKCETKLLASVPRVKLHKLKKGDIEGRGRRRDLSPPTLQIDHNPSSTITSLPSASSTNNEVPVVKPESDTFPTSGSAASDSCIDSFIEIEVGPTLIFKEELVKSDPDPQLEKKVMEVVNTAPPATGLDDHDINIIPGMNGESIMAVTPPECHQPVLEESPISHKLDHDENQSFEDELMMGEASDDDFNEDKISLPVNSYALPEIPSRLPVIRKETTVLLSRMELNDEEVSKSNNTIKALLNQADQQQPEQSDANLAEKEDIIDENHDELRQLRPHFRCNKCNKTFSSKERFESHQENHHHGQDEQEISSEESGSECHQNGEELDDDDDDDDDDDLKPSSESEEDFDEDIMSDEENSSGQVDMDPEVVSPAKLDPPQQAVEEQQRRPARHRQRFHAKKANLLKLLEGKVSLQKRKISKKGRLEKRKNESLICKICKATFASGVTLRIHHKAMHDVKNMDPSEVQRCNVSSSCTAYFRTKTQLVVHKTKRHVAPAIDQEYDDNPPVISVPSNSKVPTNPKFRDDRWCAICRLEFPCPKAYQGHLRTFHDLNKTDNPDQSVLECEQPGCGAYFLLQRQLRGHLFRAHGVSLDNKKRTKYLCSVCHHPFMQRHNRRHHYESHHDISRLGNPDDVLKCDQPSCTAYFLLRKQLDLHRRDVHGKWYECSICGKDFRSRVRLTGHRARAHRNELHLGFGCGVEGCGQKFESEEQLQAHTKFGHKNAEAGPLSCPKCGKRFQGPDSLKKHMPIHREGRVVGGARKHVCEQCGKAFKNKEALAQHYQAHAGSDSWEFQCSTCGKKCLTKGKLEEHSRTHTGDKPYCCEHCGVSYAHKHNLRIHVNSKHPEAPDLPRAFDKTNLTSRKGKGLKRKQ